MLRKVSLDAALRGELHHFSVKRLRPLTTDLFVALGACFSPHITLIGLLTCQQYEWQQEKTSQSLPQKPLAQDRHDVTDHNKSSSVDNPGHLALAEMVQPAHKIKGRSN
jgi:hypothetical protein